MTESEKLLKWLEISAYPEQEEIVRKMIEREKKLLEFVKKVIDEIDERNLVDEPSLRNEAKELLKEIGEL